MKIIAVKKQDDGTMQARLLADSTTLRSGQPFFVPDHAPHYAVEPMMALRIGRLGKCIAQRFAHRYIDAVTAVMVVRPLGDDMQPATLGGMDVALDGSVMMGGWKAHTPGDEFPAMEWSHNGTAHTLATAEVAPSPTEAIATLSRYCMLRMGDIVLLAPPHTPLEAIAIDDVFTATVGGEQVLKNKIK